MYNVHPYGRVAKQIEHLRQFHIKFVFVRLFVCSTTNKLLNDVTKLQTQNDEIRNKAHHFRFLFLGLATAYTYRAVQRACNACWWYMKLLSECSVFRPLYGNFNTIHFPFCNGICFCFSFFPFFHSQWHATNICNVYTKMHLCFPFCSLDSFVCMKKANTQSLLPNKFIMPCSLCWSFGKISSAIRQHIICWATQLLSVAEHYIWNIA